MAPLHSHPTTPKAGETLGASLLETAKQFVEMYQANAAYLVAPPQDAKFNSISTTYHNQEQCLEIALKHFKAAAELGNRNAIDELVKLAKQHSQEKTPCLALAELYAQGSTINHHVVVDTNIVNAQNWYRQARDRGSKIASNCLKAIDIGTPLLPSTVQIKSHELYTAHINEQEPAIKPLSTLDDVETLVLADLKGGEMHFNFSDYLNSIRHTMEAGIPDFNALNKLLCSDLSRKAVRTPQFKEEARLLNNDMMLFVRDALRLKSKSLVEAVSPMELLNYKHYGDKDQCPHIVALSKFINQYSNYVIKTIVTAESRDQATLTMERWVWTRDSCLQVGDFNSAAIINSALKSAAVGRLALVKESLSEQASAIADLKHGFLELQTNHQGPCIPFLGPYQTNITFDSDTADANQKNRELSNTLITINRMQSSVYRIPRVRFNSNAYFESIDEEMASFSQTIPDNLVDQTFKDAPSKEEVRFSQLSSKLEPAGTPENSRTQLGKLNSKISEVRDSLRKGSINTKDFDDYITIRLVRRIDDARLQGVKQSIKTLNHDIISWYADALDMKSRNLSQAGDSEQEKSFTDTFKAYITNDVLSGGSAQRTLAMERWIWIKKTCMERGNDFAGNIIDAALKDPNLSHLGRTQAGLSSAAKLETPPKIVAPRELKAHEKQAFDTFFKNMNHTVEKLKSSLREGETLDTHFQAVSKQVEPEGGPTTGSPILPLVGEDILNPLGPDEKRVEAASFEDILREKSTIIADLADPLLPVTPKPIKDTRITNTQNKALRRIFEYDGNVGLTSTNEQLRQFDQQPHINLEQDLEDIGITRLSSHQLELIRQQDVYSKKQQIAAIDNPLLRELLMEHFDSLDAGTNELGFVINQFNQFAAKPLPVTTLYEENISIIKSILEVLHINDVSDARLEIIIDYQVSFPSSPRELADYNIETINNALSGKFNFFNQLDELSRDASPGVQQHINTLFAIKDLKEAPSPAEMMDQIVLQAWEFTKDEGKGSPGGLLKDYAKADQEQKTVHGKVAKLEAEADSKRSRFLSAHDMFGELTDKLGLFQKTRERSRSLNYQKAVEIGTQGRLYQISDQLELARITDAQNVFKNILNTALKPQTGEWTDYIIEAIEKHDNTISEATIRDIKVAHPELATRTNQQIQHDFKEVFKNTVESAMKHAQAFRDDHKKELEVDMELASTARQGGPKGSFSSP